jgi:hypothetical protein
MAAVERQHHAMNFELALRAHRDLGGGGRIAVVAHELRDAAMHARRQRLAPVALLGRGIEHGEMLGVLVHERAAELKRGSRHTFLFKDNHKRATASEGVEYKSSYPSYPDAVHRHFP